jgi:hypothetical protein
MSLIRSRYAVSTRREFLDVLFSGLLVLGMFDPGVASAQEVKQIKLTEKHIQGFIAAFQGHGEALRSREFGQTGSRAGGAGRKLPGDWARKLASSKSQLSELPS